MIVYNGLKQDFLHSVEMDTIAQEIEDNVYRMPVMVLQIYAGSPAK